MKQKLVFLAVAGLAGGLIASKAMADNKVPADLAPKMQTCLACHIVEGRKTVGPTYKEVAAKYAGQKDVEKELVERIIKGSQPGKLKFGAVPMPPNAVSEADARAMVKWILQVK